MCFLAQMLSSLGPHNPNYLLTNNVLIFICDALVMSLKCGEAFAGKLDKMIGRVLFLHTLYKRRIANYLPKGPLACIKCVTVLLNVSVY
jgi:hypothetical protein